MNKKIFLIVFFLIVISLSSCKIVGRQKEEISKVQYGNQGLYIQFENGYPPARAYISPYYQEGQFEVIIRLENRGSSDADYVSVYLSGFDPSILQISPVGKPIGKLEGRSKYITQPVSTTVSFKPTNIILPRDIDSYRTTLEATACYKYKTRFTPTICVDPRPYEAVKSKACYPVEIKGSSGQGAPVVISYVKTESTGRKMLITIGVTDTRQQQGRVIAPEAIAPTPINSRCPFDLTYSDYDIVRYTVTSSGLGIGKCQPDVLRLINGRGEIFCSFEIPENAGSAYETVLEITLDYGYVQSIYKPVELIPIPE